MLSFLPSQYIRHPFPCQLNTAHISSNICLCCLTCLLLRLFIFNNIPATLPYYCMDCGNAPPLPLHHHHSSLFFFQKTDQCRYCRYCTDACSNYLRDVRDLRWKVKRELIKKKKKKKKVKEVKQNEIITQRSVDCLQEVGKNRICVPC